MSRGRMVTIDMNQRSKALAAPPAITLPKGAPLLSEEDTAALISHPEAVLSGWTSKPQPAPAPLTVPAPSLPKSVREETDRAKTALVEGVRHVYRGEAPARLSVDVPPAIHKALKLRCIAEEISIRDFILRAIARDGITEP